MADEKKLTEEELEALGLHSLAPAKGAKRDRKRVGRGHGSGHGKTSGRGHKGYGSRAGAKDRARFEGGQNPIHMRMRKLRGPNKKMSMPFEPFRTHTQPVNLDDLEQRFDSGASVDLDGAAGGRPGHPQGHSRQGAGPRRAVQAADRARPQVLEDRARADRGRGRHDRRRGVTSKRAMIGTIFSAFRVPEIRKKLLFTALLLALYRLGAYIPVPGVSTEAVKQLEENYTGSNVLGLLNLFSGGALSQLAIFALGIMPYITASIILQLLQVVSPALEKLSKEGEVGQARITQYTRYLTVGLAAAQAVGYVFLFRSQGNRAGVAGVRELRARERRARGALPHRRVRAADVDGRADHPARHRQRHLADDLRLDRVAHPARRRRRGGRTRTRSSRSSCRSWRSA